MYWNVPRTVPCAVIAWVIVRVLAAVGDRVSAGQGIIVIEAMKMENELRSPIDGVVKQIEAKEDQAIDAGAVLAVIEPCR